MMPLRVRYRHADNELGHRGSFLSLLVSEATGSPVDVISDPRTCVDLQLTSVQIPLTRKLLSEGRRVAASRAFTSQSARDARWRRENPEPEGNARAHIWFTAENVRPPVGTWDGYLSYDTDPLDGRNAYLPLWWHSVGLLGEPSSMFTSGMPPWEQLLQGRDPGGPRAKFVCTFINNPEPMRLHAVEALNAVGPVDVYGRAVGKPVPDKARVARDYRFVLCFENDIYPGYVTEKPFDAWATGAVPLWRGSDPAGYLNPEAMINAADYASLDDFAKGVADLDATAGAWRATAAQPLLTRRPDLGPCLSLIQKTLADR
jgi:hypothetical protein